MHVIWRKNLLFKSMADKPLIGKATHFNWKTFSTCTFSILFHFLVSCSLSWHYSTQNPSKLQFSNINCFYCWWRCKALQILAHYSDRRLFSLTEWKLILFFFHCHKLPHYFPVICTHIDETIKNQFRVYVSTFLFLNFLVYRKYHEWTFKMLIKALKAIN